jgi:dihydrofolate synthase/folylpolyglutamate synthase
MNLLSGELGRPQDSFGTIHVVGTNGKSSAARMTAAILGAHGLKAGCLVSPHLNSWSERVLVDGQEVEPAGFARAVRRTAEAAARVESGLGSGEVVTQFEIAVAAGFLALAESGVEVAAIEAGLGGRLDATNSIGSSVTVLTSIGLDHTEWLGETELEIAAEKLAVLRPGTTLVLGPVGEGVRDLALATAAANGSRVVEPGSTPPDGIELESPALYQRTNFALAIAGAGEYLSATRPGSLLEPDRIRQATASAFVPGHLERIADSPPVYVDVAHNRPGAAALAASVPGIASGRPVIGLVGILDDKDAAGILAELAPVLDFAVMSGLPPDALANSARPGAGSWDPVELARLAAESGLGAESFSEPAEALDRARKLASGRDGVVLVAGSHYLVPR